MSDYGSGTYGEGLYGDSGGEAAQDPAEAPARIRFRDLPPLRQHLIATTPSGKPIRWGEDEGDTASVLDNLEDGDTMPGGYSDMSGDLPRKHYVDYADMQPGTHIDIYGAGQRKIGEYRLERAPQITDERVVFDPSAVGYRTHLEDDKSAREIFIDADATAWGDPSAARMLALLQGTSSGAGRNQYAPSEIGLSDDAQRYGPGVVQKLGQVTISTTPIREAWYHGGGVDIGKLRFNAQQLTAHARDANMTNKAVLSSDDIATSTIPGTDYDQVTTLDQTLTATGAGYKRAIIQMLYTVALATNDYTNAFGFLFLKVLGRHGLTEHGTWPNIGILASDITAYALARWAPLLRFTTGTDGTITPTALPIPHLAFKEFTTVAEMIRQAFRFELPEWAIWNDRTFYSNPRGARGRRWHLRVRPTKLRSTGKQIDRVFNGIVVGYQDPDGSTRTVGPPGSGADVEDDRLLDTDPLNFANQLGIRRWDMLVMKGKSAISDNYEPPVQIGQRFLEASKLFDSSGEAVITGHALEASGVMFPYYDVHSGDLASFLDSSFTDYRRIIDVRRNRKRREAVITLDAPPDDMEAVLERLDVELIPLGLG